MYYIIFDLEWNNAYCSAVKGFVNEIIEIGAVKLNDRLEIVDTYKQLVKPKYSKKLSSRCKSLTKITNEEIKELGIPFKEAMDAFAKWEGCNDSVFLSWSNSDLYVLTNNFKFMTGNCDVPFMRKYCDAQKYCMSFIERENNNQVSLQRCAEIFGINVDVSALHRALADCYLTVECLKKVFDEDKLKPYIHCCDKTYYERLLYKPYLITQPVTKDYDAYKQKIMCPKCNAEMQRLTDFECVNKSFRCSSHCKKCNKKYWTTIRARKNYDRVDVYIRNVEMNKKKARKLNNK
ncbi:MAG: exonuclease domain-containing protein [Eubacterium sp.]